MLGDNIVKDLGAVEFLGLVIDNRLTMETLYG